MKVLPAVDIQELELACAACTACLPGPVSCFRAWVISSLMYRMREARSAPIVILLGTYYVHV